jgi:DNA-binding NtrC family response regulator
VLLNLETKIDLLLFDLTIPGAPSLTVATEAGRLRPDLRVLLTSAYSREMAGPVSNAAHVKEFIRKPFELRELVVLVREALSG